uniref:RING-CH-type domain-containing protein n=1 Tax=Kalanchoe fedtschenkoi TaxID=63787 RepID=A0A7N0ZV13_KALFE
MGDHFVLLVDRLLTESTLEAAIESRNRLKEAEVATYDCASHEIVIGDESYPRKVVECRICHDEDVDLKMESPCSCRGSLKYAHRRCVQRWCNEKGDTLCEICHQQFKPGYTAPPPLFQFGGIPMNFRGHWDISQRDFNNPRLVTMVSTDHNFLGIDEEDDEYSASASRSLTCCRLVAVIFTCLLILRHALPVILNQSSYSFPVLLLLSLRTFGILLPIYVMLRALTTIQRRRQQRHQDRISATLYSSDEAEQAVFPHHPQVIHVG